MSDLIDREKAMNSVADAQNILEHMDTVYDGEINRVKRAVERILAELPTIDAVPVIRCKDCKYKDDGIDEDGIPFLKCLNGRSYGGTRINDYCSWAERREE